jgi:hypothetical protein
MYKSIFVTISTTAFLPRIAPLPVTTGHFENEAHIFAP